MYVSTMVDLFAFVGFLFFFFSFQNRNSHIDYLFPNHLQVCLFLGSFFVVYYDLTISYRDKKII